MISANIGANAKGIAVGKNITQTIYEVLGEPTPDDKQIIEQQMSQLLSLLEKNQGKIDPTKANMAQFQIELLQGELTKTGEDDIPSATTITKVGNWLLENIPSIGESLAGLFVTPAVGKVIGKAGEVAVLWVKQQFGGGDY